MSYEVLARKYRPALFAEVVGQDHIFCKLFRIVWQAETCIRLSFLVEPEGLVRLP